MDTKTKEEAKKVEEVKKEGEEYGRCVTGVARRRLRPRRRRE